MDYSLAALKLLCIQLKAARRTTDSSQSSLSLGPILFQRAWLQGVIISLPSATVGDGRFLVDDGTGVVELTFANDSLNRDWKLGAYVMVVGGCSIREDNLPMIKASSQNCRSLCFAPSRGDVVSRSLGGLQALLSAPNSKFITVANILNGQFCCDARMQKFGLPAALKVQHVDFIYLQKGFNRFDIDEI